MVHRVGRYCVAFLGMIAFLGTSGCKSKEANVVSMLEAGSAEVCANDEVRTVLKTFFVRPLSDFSAGSDLFRQFTAGAELKPDEVKQIYERIRFEFDLTNATGTDKSIASVSCDTTVVVKDGDHELGRARLQYEVKKSLDAVGFIINSDAARLQQSATAHITGAMRAKVAEIVASDEQTEAAQPEAEDDTEWLDKLAKFPSAFAGKWCLGTDKSQMMSIDENQVFIGEPYSGMIYLKSIDPISPNSFTGTLLVRDTGSDPFEESERWTISDDNQTLTRYAGHIGSPYSRCE